MDEACILGGRGRVRQIPLPYEVGGETDYTVPLIVTTWGGKDDKGLVFPFLHSKTLLGFICSFILESPHTVCLVSPGLFRLYYDEDQES